MTVVLDRHIIWYNHRPDRLTNCETYQVKKVNCL